MELADLGRQLWDQRRVSVEEADIIRSAVAKLEALEVENAELRNSLIELIGNDLN